MFRPIGDRVLVKVEKTESKTTSGIIISNNADHSRVSRGYIVDLGPDAFKEKKEFTEDFLDKKIMFEKSKGMPFTEKDIDYVILDTKDILACDFEE